MSSDFVIKWDLPSFGMAAGAPCEHCHPASHFSSFSEIMALQLMEIAEFSCPVTACHRRHDVRSRFKRQSFKLLILSPMLRILCTRTFQGIRRTRDQNKRENEKCHHLPEPSSSRSAVRKRTTQSRTHSRPQSPLFFCSPPRTRTLAPAKAGSLRIVPRVTDFWFFCTFSEI